MDTVEVQAGSKGGGGGGDTGVTDLSATTGSGIRRHWASYGVLRESSVCLAQLIVVCLVAGLILIPSLVVVIHGQTERRPGRAKRALES